VGTCSAMPARHTDKQRPPAPAHPRSETSVSVVWRDMAAITRSVTVSTPLRRGAIVVGRGLR
jgi:hypothetical protein